MLQRSFRWTLPEETIHMGPLEGLINSLRAIMCFVRDWYSTTRTTLCNDNMICSLNSTFFYLAVVLRSPSWLTELPWFACNSASWRQARRQPMPIFNSLKIITQITVALSHTFQTIAWHFITNSSDSNSTYARNKY